MFGWVFDEVYSKGGCSERVLVFEGGWVRLKAVFERVCSRKGV